MRIVYYSPEATRSAPAMVARELLSGLSQKAGELPGELTVTGPDSICDHVENLGLEFIRIAEISNLVRKGDLIHIPLTPWIAPNTRFLFQVRSWFSKGTLIVNCHGDILTETWFRFINHEFRSAILASPSAVLESLLLRANDRVVVNSFQMKELLTSRRFVKKSKVVVIPNGMGRSWSHQTVPARGPSHDRTIVYHGRIAKEKGILALVEAFAQVNRTGLADKLICVGEGPAVAAVQRIAERLGCTSSIELRGWLSKEDLISILANATVCVYPSIYEPFSLSVLEALAVSSGPVCVSTSVGVLDFLEGHPRVFPMKPSAYGILQALEAALTRSREQHLDPSQDGGLPHGLTWEAVVPLYIELYERLSDHSGSRSR